MRRTKDRSFRSGRPVVPSQEPPRHAGRKRWRDGKSGHPRGDLRTHQVHISNKNEQGAVPYESVVYPGSGPMHSYKMKLSKRWVPNYSESCLREFRFPYIDKVGKMSMSTLFTWTCHPLQGIASISSTVYSRLQKVIIRRHGLSALLRHYKVLFKVSAIYAITSNTWLMDRVLGMSQRKSGLKNVKGFLVRFERRLDVSQRFVYSQVCSQTNWLTSRAERPRAKSREIMGELPFSFASEVNCTCENTDCPYGEIFIGSLPIDKHWNGFPIYTDSLRSLRASLVLEKFVVGNPKKVTGVVRRERFKRPLNPTPLL